MDMYFGRSKSGVEGKTLYISPKPYPVPVAPYDYGANVVAMDRCNLDLGKAPGDVFPWQALIGIPLMIFMVFSVLSPIGLAMLGIGTDDPSVFVDIAKRQMDFFLLVGIGGGFAVFAIINNAIRKSIKQKAQDIPIRFNRQRRQACFVPEGKVDPVVVDWEELKAWVGDYASVMQSGVLKHHSLGFAFRDKASGEEYTIEFTSTGLPMAFGTWELIRSFMDFEIDSLSDTLEQGDVGRGDQNGMEGVAFFKAKHRRLHNRFKQGEVGLFYVLGWYLYHIATLWTIPNRKVEWEVKEVARLKEDNVPEEMKRWSASLPESSWTLPSKEFLAESNEVRSIFSRNPGLPMYEVFSVVNEHMSSASVPVNQ